MEKPVMLTRLLPVLALSAMSATASAQLLNPSFETPGSSGHTFAEWDQFGGNIYWHNDPNYQGAFDGDALGKIFGNFDGNPQSDAGIYQILPTTPGQEWTASINVLHRSDDAVAGDNIGVLVLSWQDAGGFEISSDAKVILDATTETDWWIFDEVTGVAPSGTAQVGYYLLFIQFTSEDFPWGAPGAMFFDLASLEMGGSACAVDLNDDGQVNTQDFLAFLGLWSAGDPQADWNGDNTVNTIDFVAFLNDWVAGC
jgi:hypothetical protein